MKMNDSLHSTCKQFLTPAERRGVCFGVVRPSESPSVRLSVRPSSFSVRMHILVMDFQILLSPAEDFEGDIVLALSVHLFFFLSGQPAMDYGKLTKGAS